MDATDHYRVDQLEKRLELLDTKVQLMIDKVDARLVVVADKLDGLKDSYHKSICPKPGLCLPLQIQTEAAAKEQAKLQELIDAHAKRIADLEGWQGKVVLIASAVGSLISIVVTTIVPLVIHKLLPLVP